MTRWLITGASGLLGSNAMQQLAPRDVVGVARRVPSALRDRFVETDIGTAAGRASLVEDSRAGVVLHAAAIASIEECEENPELAWQVNVEASADLAAQAAASGASFVYISTDAVFDGARGGYEESDDPNPTSTYGRTKLAGERAVLAANPSAIVARVNFYGWSPSGTRSLAEFFHSRLRRGEPVVGFTDTVVSTLYVGLLVNAIAELVAAEASGVVNVVSREPTSKFDFGRRLALAFGYDPGLVRPGLSTDYLAVTRGSRLDLSTARIETILGKPMGGQQDGVDALVADLAAGRADAVKRYKAEESGVK